MGVFTTALDNLAAVEVQGVQSYPLGDTPDSLTRAQLPALILMPEAGDDSRGMHSRGMQPTGFSAGDARLSVQIAHVLIYGPAADGAGRRAALPDLVALIDDYTAALAADPKLGGALPLALTFAVRVGIVRYGGTAYYGAVFTHDWVLHVSG